MQEKRYNPQHGRSMVEMLGVLAIIGILSIGGVAGYRYAMNKIALNKWQHFMGFVSLALQDIFAKGNEINFIAYDTSTEAYEHNKQVVLDTGLIPKEYQDWSSKGLHTYFYFSEDTTRLYVMPKLYSPTNDYLEGCRNITKLSFPQNTWLQATASSTLFFSGDSPEQAEKFCQDAYKKNQENPSHYYWIMIWNLENL